MGSKQEAIVFVNFSDWRGQAVKLAIWFDGLKLLEPDAPDDAWVGRWVSVTGLVDPPYKGKSRAISYVHLSITVSAKGQIQTLSPDEGKFRLGAANKPSNTTPASNRNAEVLRTMGAGKTTSAAAPAAVASANSRVLATMQAQASKPAASATPPPPIAPKAATGKPSSPSPVAKTGWWYLLFVAAIIFVLLKACGR